MATSNEDFQLLNDLANKSFEIRYDFMKKILTVSVSVLGIIIALGSILDKNYEGSLCIRLIYTFALSTLGLGILFLGIGLYSYVLSRKDAVDQYVTQLQEKEKGLRTGGAIISNVPKFYTYSEYVGMILLSSSVLLFTAYLIVSIF